jgi:hypothetical protein
MKVFLATPRYTSVPQQSATAFTALAVDLALRGMLHDASVPWSTVDGDSNQARARNILFHAFLRSSADVMLAVDIDQVVTPAVANRLLSHRLDVVVPVINRRISGGGPVGEPLASLDIDADGLIEMKRIGFGVVAFSRDSIERMALAAVSSGEVFTHGDSIVPAIVSQVVQDGAWLAVDDVFSQRWRSLGGRMWLDADVSAGHVGTQVF